MAIATAEAIFVYADELAADVVEGYLRIQSDEAGERERRRRRVAALLLDPDGHDPEALRAPPISRAGRCRARWPRSRSPRTLRRPPSGAWTPTCWPGPTATARG